MTISRHATLRQLQVFAAVARCASMSRAAEELSLTQPAVSLAVKDLEQAAEIPLIEMQGRKLRLTEAGRELARTAAEIAARLRQVDEELQALSGRHKGTLDVVVVSTAKYFVPKLLAHFCSRLPSIEVRLRVENRDKVVTAMADYDCDLVVMGTPPREFDCESVPFATNPLGIIAAVQHPLSRRRALHLADLKTETFLVREIGSGTRAAMDRYFSANRFTPVHSYEMSSNETIKQATMAGMGVAFVSLRTVQHEVAEGRLALLALVGLPIVRHWHVVHLKARRLAPVAQEFKAFLLAEGPGLVELA